MPITHYRPLEVPDAVPDGAGGNRDLTKGQTVLVRVQFVDGEAQQPVGDPQDFWFDAGMTLAQMEARIKAEAERRNNLAAVRAALKSFIGQTRAAS